MAQTRPPFTQRLATYSVTHPFRVIVAWAVICGLMGVLAATSLQDKLNSTFTLGGNYESVLAQQTLEDAGLGSLTDTRETILITSNNSSLHADADAFKNREREIAEAIRTQLGEALTQANHEPVEVAPLTVEDVKSGKLPSPSVINRTSIEDLIDEEKARQEAAFKARGEALQQRGKELTRQQESLANTQQSIQIQARQGQLSPEALVTHTQALQTHGQTLQAQGAQLQADRDALNYDISLAQDEGAIDKEHADAFMKRLVGKDGQSSMILVNIGQPSTTLDIETWQHKIRELSNDNFKVVSLGQHSIQHEFSAIVEEDLTRAELSGVPFTLLVLIVVFGAVIAALNSLLLAVVAITGALGLTALVGQFMDLQLFVTNMISMLGLAVGIDYCLFVTERYRKERRQGRSVHEAIVTAGATSGMAMTFSGITVILSLLGIMFVPLNVYQSMSTGAVLVVSVAVAAVLTLLPAVLALLGDRINWPIRTWVRDQHGVDEGWLYGGFFGKLTKASITHPWKVMIGSVALLIVLATPALNLKTGFVGADSLPRGEVSDALHHLYEQWTPGQLFPVEIVARTPAHHDELNAIEEELFDDPQVDALAPIETSDDGKVKRLDVYLTTSPSDPKTYDWIRLFRAQHTGPTPDQSPLLVGGQSAGEVDMQLMLQPITPLAIAFVLALSFVLLMVAFRSIVVPIKAMVYNLLSVGATYGVMTLVFARGWGLDLLGYTPSPVIEAWLPILLFCVLFGLSMDYHVFILSRMREHYDLTGNNRESVAVGIRSTSRIITGAALIMVVVFLTFSFGSASQIQQLGFGLAVAVFLDATIIRSLLVPSLMVLMNNLNWWLPRWLHWLPKIHIEGQQPSPIASASTSPLE